MKYDRNLSNLDKHCEELFNNEMEKIENKISNRLKFLNNKMSKFDEIYQNNNIKLLSLFLFLVAYYSKIFYYNLWNYKGSILFYF